MNWGNFFRIVTVVITVISGACAIPDTPAPPLVGPSEMALSLALAANPDMIPENGVSQSVISVVARDSNGEPVRNLQLRVDTVNSSDAIVDFGTLSSREISTDNAGRASVVYTAPISVFPGADQRNVAIIRFLPISSDFGATTPRFVNIRLVPQKPIILPGAPIPDFIFSPISPTVGQKVFFDASSSVDLDGTIVSYRWEWGDGDIETRTTPTEEHDFVPAGTYYVKLIVTDNSGLQSFKFEQVVVR